MQILILFLKKHYIGFMQDIILLTYIISLVSGSATLGIGFTLYLRSRKAVIRWFLWFIFSLFLLLLSFVFGLLNSRSGNGFLDFSILALICGRTGAMIFITSAPSFYFSLLGIDGGGKLRIVRGVLVIVSLALFAANLVLGDTPLVSILLMVLFTAIILFGLVLLMAKMKTIAAGSLRRALLVFFGITVVFVPLFIIDMNLSRIKGPAWLHNLDNITQPLYFLILSACCIFFALRYLSQPSLRKDGVLTFYFLEKYGITEREGEIIDKLLLGLSSKEIAEAVYISPKTVDNHIYNIFRKLNINNRMQLVQMINLNAE